MGEIPVLEDDGVKLTQTAPILLRLAARYGRFQGVDEPQRFELPCILLSDGLKELRQQDDAMIIRLRRRLPLIPPWN